MSDDVAKELRYVGAQMEQILSEVKAVQELVAAQPTLADFHRLEGDVAELKQAAQFDRNMAARTDHEVADLKQRVSRLEAA